MQDTSATSCSPLARSNPTTAKWVCTKHRWKIWISILITGPLEFGKYLVQGHGDCLSTATVFQALIFRFPLPAHAHKHTEGSPRSWLQSLSFRFPWCLVSAVAGSTGVWIPLTHNSLSLWTLGIQYTNMRVELTQTHILHYEKLLEVEFNKKTGWMGGEVQSMAREVFLMCDWPFFFSFCSLDPCFSSAWCLKLSFPCLWFFL